MHNKIFCSPYLYISKTLFPLQHNKNNNLKDLIRGKKYHFKIEIDKYSNGNQVKTASERI